MDMDLEMTASSVVAQLKDCLSTIAEDGLTDEVIEQIGAALADSQWVLDRVTGLRLGKKGCIYAN